VLTILTDFERWDWALTVIFIAVAVDAAIAVADEG